MKDSLSERVLAGDPRAMARAISLIEDEAPEGAELVRRIFSHTGRAYLVGITGLPGAGKSTLVDRLIAEFRRADQPVGVVAVDPTSPYTGGAILGDRVRMQAHVADAGVFIRSMATRGNLGGLARATGDAALVLDAAGKQIVLIETVGVGQDEVDIVRTADVSIVTLVPGTGDEVQALKAGIMEIADIFVVNKADREGADRTVASIEAMLSLESFEGGRWRPPIVKTEATTGKGVSEL
ncbi:MAG TPA: methylmalonyl Co-A mutase-associated GTPase MeaB, partial [Vicinamibacterales bacterium]|nr:methylmalonyl Co-A mutase-associated GTPase MeaB [Vicinamibacterales bacterium]